MDCAAFCRHADQSSWCQLPLPRLHKHLPSYMLRTFCGFCHTRLSQVQTGGSVQVYGLQHLNLGVSFHHFQYICFFCHILGAYQHHTLSHFLLWHEILWAWVPLLCCLHQCLYYQLAIGHFPTKIRLCVAHISFSWSIWPIIKNTPGICGLQASLPSIFSFAHALALFQCSVCSTCWLSGVFITQVLS